MLHNYKCREYKFESYWHFQDYLVMDRYCATIIVNNRYLKGAIVTLFSFFEYNKWFDGDIVILFDNKYCILSEDNKELLSKSFKNVVFKECKPDNYLSVIKQSKGKMNERFIPSMYTIESFGLSEYKKVLYLDADLIFLNSIKEFFEDDTFLCAVPTNRRINRKINTPIFRKEQLFNCGILLINNPSVDIYNEILNTKIEISEKFTGQYLEQDVLNFYTIGKSVKLYPVAYNDCKIGFQKNIDLEEVKIIHYVGPTKPWSEVIPTDTMINIDIWNYFYKKWQRKFENQNKSCIFVK